MLPSYYYSSTTLFSFPRRMLLHHHHQPPPPPSPPSDESYGSPSPEHVGSFDDDVVMIFSVLLCLLIFSICVNCLIRCMLKCLTMITQEQRNNSNNNSLQKEVVTCGVDRRALKTFPVVRYSNEVKIQGLSCECVICLSEFKGREKVRILPKCHHGFHVKCIDKWLSSQSSCPTCRQSIVDTCQKIIGSDDDHHHHHHEATSSSPSSPSSSSSPPPVPPPPPPSSSSRDTVAISIVPLEREDVIRNQS